jgi:ADP-heptose:LPS heptosyltransferase
MWGYPRLAYYLLRPRTVFLRCATHGLGDNLLLSAVLPWLREKYSGHKIVVETRWPALFKNNPYANWVTGLHMKTTARHIKPKYHIDRETTTSIYRQLMKWVGASGEGYPEVFLSADEIARAERQFPFDFVTICPKGKTTFAANRKEWGFDNFQDLRNMMSDTRFIQVGTPADPLLENVVDCRHLPVRRTAAVIRGSHFFIGLEGGLMHLAKAVGREAAIVYGGCIRPEVSGYAENLNIYQSTDCSPCFHSDYHHEDCETMVCMKSITPQMVLERLRAWQRSGSQAGGPDREAT